MTSVPHRQTAAISRRIRDYLSQVSHIFPHRELSPIKIDHVCLETFDTFLHDYGDEIRLRHLKIEFDSHSSWITVRHRSIITTRCSVPFSFRGTTFDTDTRPATLGVREISFRSRDGSFLRPGCRGGCSRP